MKREYSFPIPNNISIENLIKNNPVEHIPGYKLEKLLYIIDCISSIPSYNKDLFFEDGFVPLNAEKLRDAIGRTYPYYITYLIDAGILICDNWFSRGLKKSRGYKFSTLFETQLQEYKIEVGKVLIENLFPPEEVVITEPLIEPIRVVINGEELTITNEDITEPPRQVRIEDKLPIKHHELNRTDRGLFYSMMRGKYPYVFKWSDRKGFKIDYEKAHAYNAEVLVLKKKHSELLDKYIDKKGKVKVKNAHTQYMANYKNIEKIKNGYYLSHFDSNVFRFHTPLSNIKSELRNAITWQGQELGAVDISASQPTLLSGLFNSEFWLGTKEFSFNSIPFTTSQSIFNTIKPPLPLITLCNFINDASNENTTKYKELIQSGEFYNSFRNLVQQETGQLFGGADIKPAMFMVLFTANQFIGQAAAGPKRIFRRLFSEIYQMCNMIKKVNSEALPVLLQRMESTLMYDKILRRVEIEYPDLPVFPIHDSIVTIKGMESYIEAVMRDEIKKAISITPHFKIEEWNLENLDKSLEKMTEKIVD